MKRKIASIFSPLAEQKILKKERVLCPLCHTTFEMDSAMLNLHIDACLRKQEYRNSQEARHQEIVENFSIIPVVKPQGVFLIPNFISEDEEAILLRVIDDVNSPTKWHVSAFNGQCRSKVWGVRTQFGLPGEARLVRENDESKGEQPIPSEFQFLVHRLRLILCHHHHNVGKSMSSSSSFFTSSNPLRLPNEALNFAPNDCNANAYIRSRGDYLTPHFDDRALSGPLLMNLSLESDAYMTYVHPKEHSTPSSSNIKVHLKQRTLQLVCGEGRWDYMHCILAEDLDPVKRRVSLTFRQSGGKLSKVQPRSDSNLANRIDIQIHKMAAQQSALGTVEKLKTPVTRDEGSEDKCAKARPHSTPPAPVSSHMPPRAALGDSVVDNGGNCFSKSYAAEGMKGFSRSVKDGKVFVPAVEVIELLDD